MSTGSERRETKWEGAWKMKEREVMERKRGVFGERSSEGKVGRRQQKWVGRREGSSHQHILTYCVKIRQSIRPATLCNSCHPQTWFFFLFFYFFKVNKTSSFFFLFYLSCPPSFYVVLDSYLVCLHISMTSLTPFFLFLILSSVFTLVPFLILIISSPLSYYLSSSSPFWVLSP